MKNVYSLSKFARYVGYKSARNREFNNLLKRLSCSRAIDIQQSGFSADSLHHKKLVIVRNQERIEEIKGYPHIEKNIQETIPKTKKRKQRIRVITKVIVRNMQRVTKRIGVTLITRTSGGKGPNSGIYLYVPKDHVDAYGIVSGQKVEIKLIRVQKEIPDKAPPEATDLSTAKPTRRKKIK